jgi:thiol-disulfide isomerase/thioredoxin
MIRVTQSLRLCAAGLLLLLLGQGCDRTVQNPTTGPNGSGGSKDSTSGDQTQSDTAERKNQDIQHLVDDDPLNSERPRAQTADNQRATEAPQPETPPAPEAPAEERVFSLEVNRSDDPTQMVESLNKIDQMIEKLLLSQSQMKPESVRQSGINLAKTKLAAALHLATLPSASDDQKKIATKAQLIALSHLSGLKDVQAARQLEAFAKELQDNPDSELRQQGRVVLFGFGVQDLQNGIVTDPQVLVGYAKSLIEDERYRGRLEMTSIQHAISVLAKLGYTDQISQLQRISFESFSNSADQPLRLEAWNQLVYNSPAQIEFLDSMATLGTTGFDRQRAFNAVRKLIEDFPNPLTLESLAITVPTLEYAGQAEFSSDLAKLIEAELPKISSSISAPTIQAILAEHNQRMKWIGRPLEMVSIVDLDGKPLDLGQLAGKVVLLNFGVSTELNCMKEIPFMDQAHKALSKEGFEIVQINMDSDTARLKKLAQDNPKPWKTYISPDGDVRLITQHFGITMFPHMILVGRDGIVKKIHVRGEQIMEQAKLLLSK